MSTNLPNNHPNFRRVFVILACRVIDGRTKGSECIFPFRFNGSIYDGCILEEVDSEQFSFAVESWCSTEVIGYAY